MEVGEGLGGFGFEAGVGFQFEEFGDRLYIPQLCAPGLVLFEPAGAIVEGLEDGLGAGLVIPEPRLGGLLFEVVDFGVEGGEVKDSPGLCPGGQ